MRSASEIKEYLGMCKDLEEEIYMQNRLIAFMKHSIGQLGYERYYAVPEKEIINDDGLSLFCFLLGILIFLVALWFFKVLEIFQIFNLLVMIVGGIIFLLGIITEVDEGKCQQEANKQYEAKMAAYNLAIKRDDLRVENELRQKEYLQEELNRLLATNRQTRAALQDLYNKNVIHSNYRGLIPICSLYGYFDTGVCTQLEGHEGAYSKYDIESRLDKIIVKLDEVIRRLEEIKQTQWVLYDAIQKSTRKANQLLKGCKQISYQLNGIQSQGAELNARIANLQSASALNLYISACNKKELEYIARADRIF